jgi:hypothetical protein
MPICCATCNSGWPSAWVSIWPHAPSATWSAASWLRWGVSYIIGLQKNSRLAQQGELAELALADQCAARKVKQCMFGEFEYAAPTWHKPRRVIARLAHGEQGANPRFVVTDLPGSAKALYERRYGARGEAENRIKEAQLDLFGRRASSHRFQANQLRLLLAALAFTATIRTRLLKIGAAIVRNTRRVRVLLASAHPMKHVFIAAAGHAAASLRSHALPAWCATRGRA